MDDFLRYVLDKHTDIDNILYDKLINRLLAKEEVGKSLEWIQRFQDNLIKYFMMYQEIEEFKEEHLVLPNGEVNRGYTYTFDLAKYPNLIITKIAGLEELGLVFSLDDNTISGTPTNMTSSKIDIYFSHKKGNDKEKEEEVKSIYFMINANPRSLWKDLPSDPEGMFSQEDSISSYGEFLDKRIVSASKRGRSHAHIGSYRDDTYGVQKLDEHWSLISVADGAGSAQYSRKGAELVTTFITTYFQNTIVLSALDLEVEGCLVNSYQEMTEIAVSDNIKEVLSTAVSSLYAELDVFSKEQHINLDDLHTTLAFVLCRKCESGYLIYSFSVGDCPIVVFSEEQRMVKVLNTLDVGEFGGGTRFVTMNEIYKEPLANRIHAYYVPSFTYLFLMSDGIYDPKFGTEQNLTDIEYWDQFILDLKGDNEDHSKVDLENDSIVAEQLLVWMDFWSKGNHDDRTLVIVY